MYKIENLTVEDYELVRQKMRDWYPLIAADLQLPRLFFKHFSFTSFIISDAKDVLGVMIAFPSLYQANTACIHLLAINPHHKELGIEKELFKLLKETTAQYRVNKVEYILHPQHHAFIELCKRLEFETKTGDKVVGTISTFSDYDGIGQDRAIFVKQWEMPAPPQPQQ